MSFTCHLHNGGAVLSGFQRDIHTVASVISHHHKQTYIPLDSQWWFTQAPSYMPYSHTIRSTYHQISNISRTKSQSFNDSRIVLQLSFPIHWSQVVSREWICSWSSADRLHLSDQQLYCLLRCDLLRGFTVFTYYHKHNPFLCIWTRRPLYLEAPLHY